MPIDYSVYPLNKNAFGSQPFTFLSGPVANALTIISGIDLIENGSLKARDLWQTKQIANLIDHARQRSVFWRKRLPKGGSTLSPLSSLPILSRADLARQIKSEGPLVSSLEGNATTTSYISSGSTGAPVKVFVLPQNGHFNVLRSQYEYFAHGWDVTCNRTRIFLDDETFIKTGKLPATVKSSDCWLGNLAQLFKNGTNREIGIVHATPEVLDIIKSAPIGYLVSNSRILQELLKVVTPKDLKEWGMIAWLQLASARDQNYVHALESVGIKCRSSYSCSEAGPIAFECVHRSGYFHVCHSNVVVEKDDSQIAWLDGKALSRILITHLHSYATPLIRYDVGDFAEFHETCPCGFNGPVLSNIYGRGKHFFHYKDGSFGQFFISGKALTDVATFKEIRFVQTTYSDIVMTVSGVACLQPDQIDKFAILVRSCVGPDVQLTIRCVDEMDWSDNVKRLEFVSRVIDEQ